MAILAAPNPATQPNSTNPGLSRRELLAMHRYCLKYRALVRSNGTPSDEQSRTFILFSATTYEEGIACE